MLDEIFRVMKLMGGNYALILPKMIKGMIEIENRYTVKTSSNTDKLVILPNLCCVYFKESAVNHLKRGPTPNQPYWHAPFQVMNNWAYIVSHSNLLFIIRFNFPNYNI